jgi:hypothetical protein
MRELWFQIMHLACTCAWGAVTGINSEKKKAFLYLTISFTRRKCLTQMNHAKDLLNSLSFSIVKFRRGRMI